MEKQKNAPKNVSATPTPQQPKPMEGKVQTAVVPPSKQPQNAGASPTESPKVNQNQQNGEVNKKPWAATPRLSRIDEKNVLAHLNDRLAGIIDRNRTLENENSQLVHEIQTSEQKIAQISTTLKASYEKENSEIKNELILLEKEKAKLVLSENNNRRKLKEAEDRIQKLEAMEKKLEKDIDELKEKLKKKDDDLKKEDDENKKIKKSKEDVENQNKKLQKEIDDLKKINEELLLAQADLQNTLKRKNDELTLKAQLHLDEMKAVSMKSATTIQKIGEQAKKDFEAKLEEAIKNLRKDCEQQIIANAKETSELNAKKEGDLKAQIGKLNDSLKSKAIEIATATTKIIDFQKILSQLEGEKHTLKEKIKSGEEMLQKVVKEMNYEIDGLKMEIKELKDDKHKLIDEYHHLMEIKVALDNEIAVYRNLLETEEARLNIKIDPASIPVPAKAKKESMR